MVPPGCIAGDTFYVTIPDGRRLSICCPEDVEPGALIEIIVPPSDEPASIGQQPVIQPVPAMETNEIIVPDGMVPGDSFIVQAASGGMFDVIVPEGIAPGTAIFVELPAATPASSPFGDQAQVTAKNGNSALGSETKEVVVPEGMQPGDSFSVQASWGGMFELTVPDGTVSGTSIFIELPSAPPKLPSTPPRSPKSRFSRRSRLSNQVTAAGSDVGSPSPLPDENLQLHI